MTSGERPLESGVQREQRALEIAQRLDDALLGATPPRSAADRELTALLEGAADTLRALASRAGDAPPYYGATRGGAPHSDNDASRAVRDAGMSMPIEGAFHAHSGWQFKRDPERADHSLEVVMYKDGIEVARFDAGTWASIYESVSAYQAQGDVWRVLLEIVTGWPPSPQWRSLARLLLLRSGGEYEELGFVNPESMKALDRELGRYYSLGPVEAGGAPVVPSEAAARDSEHQHLRDAMVRIAEALGHSNALILEVTCKEGETPAQRIAAEVEALVVRAERGGSLAPAPSGPTDVSAERTHE